MVSQTISLDGTDYTVTLRERQPRSSGAEPILCIVSYLPHKAAIDIIRIAVDSIRKYTTIPYSLWVVDNASPPEHLAWLRNQKDITLVENLTPPPKNGSYANAIGLEICASLVPAETTRFMALHQDILVCKYGWLEYLLSKFSDKIRAVGVREDFTRVPKGILHVLGYIVDFQLFRKLGLDFYPRLPRYDVGDMAIDSIRQAGYEYFATPNTLWQPEIAETLPKSYSEVKFDRAIDDTGDVFFMHLGRGSLKISPDFPQDKKKSLAQWRLFSSEVLKIFIPIEIIPHYTESKLSNSSCRRWHLDAFLTGTPWHGRILDIGGKKENKRGSFRPPLEAVKCWEYVNIDATTQPDYLAPAESVPVPDASFDMVLLSEVLEHLPEPEEALAEAFRILRPGGALVCAAPFLYPLHADPEDYQRWLPSKYERVLGAIGFAEIKITPMGGFFAVCHDLLQSSSRFWFRQEPRGAGAALLRLSVPIGLRLLFRLERRFPDFFRQAVTTGYYVCAYKTHS